MDNLTHSLVGALIGQAGLKRKTGLAMPALVIGANLPDVDAACFFWLEGLEHLAFRRGITHGPPALVLLPLLLAGLLYGFDRWQAQRGKRPEDRLPVRFKWLFLLSFLGCLTHPALDWLNVYGIRLLEPFSSRWFYGDVLFIIDVWLWAILGAGVWLSLRREKHGGEWTRPARIAGAVGLAYIGVNGAITAYTERDGQIFALMDFGSNQPTGSDGVSIRPDPSVEVIASPHPLAFWRRDILYGKRGEWVEVYENSYDDRGGQNLADRPCDWPPLEVRQSREGRQVAAFLFWSRAPFAERAPDGSVILRDARYTDPRVRDRFSVALPDVRCEPVTG